MSFLKSSFFRSIWVFVCVMVYCIITAALIALVMSGPLGWAIAGAIAGTGYFVFEKSTMKLGKKAAKTIEAVVVRDERGSALGSVVKVLAVVLIVVVTMIGFCLIV